MYYSNGFGGGGEFMFTVFPVIFFVMFAIFIVAFIVNIVKGISTWGKNNNSPELTVDATVVTKRNDVHTHHHNHDDHMHTSHSTTYYVTFQVVSGDRIELKVPSKEYGMLVEGDVGRLTFQGTRFKSFERMVGNLNTKPH